MYWISMAAFVDLARCPVVFCLAERNLDSLICFLSKHEDRVNLPGNEKFKVWWEARPPGDTPEDVYYEKANLIYSETEIIRASLMQLRACFTLSIRDTTNKTERDKLLKFFRMDYNEWIKLLVEEHITDVNCTPALSVSNKVDALMLSMNIEREVQDSIHWKTSMQVMNRVREEYVCTLPYPL
jgi:hypothetical protein